MDECHFPSLALGNFWLIRRMIQKDPRSRPNVEQILFHPTFWAKERSLNFLNHVSDTFTEYKEGEVGEFLNVHKLYIRCFEAEVLKAYNSPNSLFHATEKTDWMARLCPEVQMHMQTNKFRINSKSDDVIKLLRLIRNIKHHFGSMPKNVKDSVGSPPDKYYDYWITRFPYLVSSIWVLCQDLGADETDSYQMKQFYATQFKFETHVLTNRY